jgi:hypothetical protein
METTTPPSREIITTKQRNQHNQSRDIIAMFQGNHTSQPRVEIITTSQEVHKSQAGRL